MVENLNSQQLQSNEEMQTTDINALKREFPQEDEIIIVDIYYNQADQNLLKSKEILKKKYPQEYFGQSVLGSPQEVMDYHSINGGIVPNQTNHTGT